MIIVPFFPQLHLILDIIAPLCIYGVLRWVMASPRLTDPAQRCRLLWWLALFPIVSKIWVGVLPGWRQNLLDSISLGFGMIHSGSLHPLSFAGHSPHFAQLLPPFRGHPPILLICIHMFGAVFAIAAGARDYARVALAVRRLPQRNIDGVLILDTPGWSAFTFGLARPQVYMSAEVWESEHRDAVLAHERAHAERRDPLLRFLLHGMRRLFWYFPFWTPILAQGEFEAERVCDRQACAVVGRRRYAQALLAFAEHAQRAVIAGESLLPRPPFSAASRYEDYDLLARARALAQPVPDRTPPRFWFWFVLIYILVNVLA